MQQLEESIARYLADLDRRIEIRARSPKPACAFEGEGRDGAGTMQRLQHRRTDPRLTNDLTDRPTHVPLCPVARGGRLQRADRGGCQAHLVVTHEVTNQGTDRSQLASMGKKVPKPLC
jgi:hypothetical protein